jgi:hypothetical protein
VADRTDSAGGEWASVTRTLSLYRIWLLMHLARFDGSGAHDAQGCLTGGFASSLICHVVLYLADYLI